LALAEKTEIPKIIMVLDTVFYLECWFEGHVQGVGFRYQSASTAKGFEVSGTVQNLADGRVFLRAEGEEPEVRAFHHALADEMEDYIKEMEIKTGSGSRKCLGFSILS
jgi:acylphosphatase